MNLASAAATPRVLPGAPVVIESVEERLSPMATTDQTEDEYGPALPPGLGSRAYPGMKTYGVIVPHFCKSMGTLNLIFRSSICPSVYHKNFNLIFFHLSSFQMCKSKVAVNNS